jgi:hypothetical protein
MTGVDVDARARTALGLLRLLFGTLGLLAPGVLIRRIEGADDDAAAVHAFRMFGIRTIVLGRHLLVQRGPHLRSTVNEALLIHGADTASAVLLTAGGRVPRRAGYALVLVSTINTALALAARRGKGNGKRE